MATVAMRIRDRAIVELCKKRKLTKIECFKELEELYGRDRPALSTISRIYDAIDAGIFCYVDPSPIGPAIDEDLVVSINRIVRKNPYLSLRQIANLTQSNKDTVRLILTKVLLLKKRYCKWVPHSLDKAQKKERVRIALIMLDILKKEEAVGFAHVITGDESWFLYNYPFKTFWGKASDSAPKITHPDISSEKSMLVVFWGVATTPILTFLPRGLSVNAALFQELVVKPLSKINSSLPKGENLLIHWDNAPAHRATTTTSLIEKRKLTLIPQPPYSPDLAPSDFFLFGYIKGQLRGKGFKTLIDLEQEIKSIMERITPVTRIRVFQHWIWRLEAVIASEGEYYDAC